MRALFITFLLGLYSLAQAGVVEGRAVLEEQEKKWVPSWLVEWGEMEEFLDRGVKLKVWDEALVRKWYKGKGLLDPQGFLTTEADYTVKEMLKKHSKSSRLPLNILVFGGEQDVVVSAKELYAKFYGEQPGLLVIYYRGAGLRNTGYVNGGEYGEAGEFEIKDLFKNSSIETQDVVGADEHLCAFVSELSKRLYWIEKELVGNEPIIAPKEEKAIEEPVAEKKSAKAIFDELVAEYGILPFYLIGGLVTLVFVWLAGKIYSKKRSFKFPPHDGMTRLGAENGAEIGEVVKFINVRESLSEQKRDLSINEL